MTRLRISAFLLPLCLPFSLLPATSKNFRISAVQENQVWIEGGLLDGLVEGMRGEIYYEIKIAGQAKRIIPAKVRLYRVEDRQSIGTLSEESGIINVGYSATLTPKPVNELLMIYHNRGIEAFTAKDYNLAKEIYQRILEALPGDPFAGRRIQECDVELAKQAELARERRNVPYYKQVLAATLKAEDPDVALARIYVDKILAVLPKDAEALKFQAQLDRPAPGPEPEPEPVKVAAAGEPAKPPPPLPEPAAPAAEVVNAETPAAGETGGRAASKADLEPPPILKDMVLVPEGDPLIGTEIGQTPFANETPRQAMHVAAFYIDKYEVTNEDYKRFCEATGRGFPSYFLKDGYPEGTGRLPVVMISWIDADAYASWAGKRLPTEREWEAAAAGIDGLIWPWGNEWDPALANTREGGNTAVAEVGSFPGDVSPYGVYDMAGNVSEWTVDWYRPYSGNTRREREYGEQFRVLRGGSVKTSREFARAQFRARLPDGFRSRDLGFRCAISARDVKN